MSHARHPVLRPTRPTRRTVLAAALAAAGLAALPSRATTLAAGSGPSASAVDDAPENAYDDTPDDIDNARQAGGGGGGGLPPHFPQQDPALVQRVVGASHGDLATVRELVGRWPELAKAQWDWGFGDWESALGAASHTGNREIAELLIGHGARPTLFSAAMLGQLAVVRAFVEAAPGVQATPGPHGIPLLVHARTGGAAAEPVVAYLEEVGGAAGDEVPTVEPERVDRYLGAYRADLGPADRGETVWFDVTLGPMGLTLARRDGVGRRLVPKGGDAFHPAGAPSVAVTFAMGAAPAPASAFTLRTPEVSLRAVRVTDPG